MSEHLTLDAVLNGTLVPHQPLLVIVDSAVFSGLPVFREALRRALASTTPVTLVTAQHDASELLPSFHQNVNVVDIASSGSPLDSFDGNSPTDIQRQILDNTPSGSHVFIDALDIIAEDTSASMALTIIQSLLTLLKPPSRLTLLLPHQSTLLPTLISPSLSSSLTLIHPLHPAVVSHLSRAYLSPISSSAAFWQILEKAKIRRVPEQLAYKAQNGVEVLGDWSQGGVKGAIVQVLVRKPTGGVKGISRSLAALVPTPSKNLEVRDISELVDVNPINAAPQLSNNTVDAGGGPATPADMNLPFNLSLTDEQKRRRGEVPLPYAHEGEGVGMEMEFGDEDDEDDEEI